MSDINNSKSKYIDILNRIHKKFSVNEGLFIIKKLFLTDNTIYYFLCLLFRFIHLLSFSGDMNFTNRKNSSKAFQQYFNILTCYNLVKQFNFSYTIYAIINLIILLLLIIYTTMNYYTLKKLENFIYSNKFPLPNKFKIVLEHIIFLLFPYIIEYLSFSYYIYFFPNKFIITFNLEKGRIIISFNIIINTILIILCNIDNYIGMICSNKKYTITIFEANSENKTNKEQKNHKSVAYRCSNTEFYILIILQNFVLFLTIENYINKRYKIIFKIIISIILLLSILIIFLNKIHQYNYLNFINTSINIILLLCFYSIILDIIIFIIKNRTNRDVNQIIYFLFKCFLSYISYLLFEMKKQKFLGNKITELLFQEKNDKKRKGKYFLNSFYLLHQMMLKIFDENKIESSFILFKYFSSHINNCHQIDCKCKLFQVLTKREKKNSKNEEELKNEVKELLIILNYLFENAFLDYNFYNDYELTILLAEHFCYLRKNPTMSFSLISTLILKQRNKLTIIQMSELYELNQKYIYYISAKIYNDIEKEIVLDKTDLLRNKMIEDEFKSYYYNLKLSNKIKKIFTNYINNALILIKYKNIFEDSLSFQYDENNESIISVKINYFEQNIKIDGLDNSQYTKKNYKSKKTFKSYDSNLYNNIYLLKKEKMYYQQLIDSVNQVQIIKSMPIFMIFKYFLFFDIFCGGKIPEIISSKLYSCLYNKNNINNHLITKNEFLLLRKRYNEQNNQLNAKTYVIVEFKKELRTKYFSEDGALKLGFKQKEIINEKIDLLMPIEFCKSHQNAIKQLIIGSQIRYSISKQSYYFNKNTTRLYSANFEGALVYNISKSLLMILESYFNFEYQYRFMLDSNFELLANSRNFEDEYYLNKKILQTYNIKFLDILKLKPEKINKKFADEFKKMKFQNLIRQFKIHEYFIPEFYVPPGDKVFGIKNPNYFNASNRNILSKLLNSNNNNNYMNNENDDEQMKLIQKENNKTSINELFIQPREIVFHKSFNMTLNKGHFIENIAKELVKIPDNDLIMENDKNHYNLILSAKQLISKLLTKKEIINHFLRISFSYSFYYDKPFYFITIYDDNKVYLKMTKYINFENNEKKLISSSSFQSNIISKNNSRKSRNKNIIILNKKDKKSELSKENNKKYNKNIFMNNNVKDNNYNVLNKINENKKKINKDKFISIIKWILSIIIIFIIIFYIVLINFQKILINNMELILLSFYYCLYTKNLFIEIFSVLIQIYYDSFILKNSTVESNSNEYVVLTNLTNSLKVRYHDFTNYFLSYNLAIGHDFNLIYQYRNFSKLRGYWQEIQYESKFTSELDYVIYNILSYNPYHSSYDENLIDFKNLLFFKDRTETKEKINGVYVKLLYYLSSNYEFVYKDLFQEFEDEIYESHRNYISTNLNIYIIFEALCLLLYIVFFIIIIFYLYYYNNIIIKNIIFLFIDFSEDLYDKNKFDNINNIITLKLKELQYVIDDFDIQLFKKYIINIDNLNNNNYNNSKNDEVDNFNIKNDTNHKNLQELEKKINNHETLRQPSLRKQLSKNSNKNINEERSNSNKNNLLIDMKNKMANNSSHNYLVESNSSLFKNKLNNHSINLSNELLYNNKNEQNLINSKMNIAKQKIDNNKLNENKTIEQENIHDMLLNGSNKTLILKCKIYFILILILIIIVIFFLSYKFKYILSFENKYQVFFNDLSVITNRYVQIYYYFNTLRTLLIFPDGKKKKIFENILENLNELYEKENTRFNEISLKRIKNYKEINKLFKIIKDTQNDTNFLKETFCLNDYNCENYLDSEYNSVNSGIDFAFKSFMTQVINLYLDYKSLKNKFDIEEIKTKLFSSNFYFSYIAVSLNKFFECIERKIFISFGIDEKDFTNYYIKYLNILNIFSIIYSIFIFLFVIIYIFSSISNFTAPIKESTYRINCSFYHIKKYSLTIYRRNDSML